MPRNDAERSGICCIAVALIAAFTGSANAATWDGGDADDNNWSSGDNWTSNTAPAASNPLVFTGSARLSPGNDIAADTDFGSITFDNSGGEAGAFMLSGNRIDLISGAAIINHSSSLQTLALDLRLLSTNHVIDTASGDITITGIIVGGTSNRTFSKSGDGMLTLGGSASNGTNIASLTASAGTVQLDKSGTASAISTVILSGATVKLTGTSTDQISGSVTINSGILDLNGKAETVSTLSGSGGSITNTQADTTATLTVSVNSAVAYSGTIEDTGTGKVALVLVNNQRTLSGANTYSGGTNAAGANLILANDQAGGTGTITTGSGGSIASNGVDREFVNVLNAGSGNATFGGGSLSFHSLTKGTGNANWTVNSNRLVFRNNSSSPGGTIVKQGVGAMIFLANYSQGGVLTIGNGEFVVAGTYSGPSAQLSGGGMMGRNGSITAAVSNTAANSVYWFTNHSGGLFAYGVNPAWGDSSNNLLLNFGGGASLTWNGTGSSFISSGQVLRLGHELSNGTVTLQNNVNLNNVGQTVEVAAGETNPGTGVDAILAGKLTAGGLTKTGNGRLAITNGTNDYALGTTVAAGILQVSGALGTGNVSVSAGATLQLNTGTAIANTVTLTMADGSFLNITGSNDEAVAVLVLGDLSFNTPAVFNAGNNYHGFADPGEFFAGSTGSLTVVPEPTGPIAAGLAGLGLLYRRRRVTVQ